MNIPKDPIILLSFINTQLRDNYKNLDELCTNNELNKDELVASLSTIDYHYDETTNQFV